ncbi:hypothetical protein IAQ61_000264 [Plenodomus lingam]|uniref:uncharacterized protein n=1 Tax=Leptosphaeria maculans TaxID=5022 RepID=UPI003317D1C6|nr:hypothetical protein IAQ61_000264 [Plenodomus lingam]
MCLNLNLKDGKDTWLLRRHLIEFERATGAVVLVCDTLSLTISLPVSKSSPTGALRSKSGLLERIAAQAIFPVLYSHSLWSFTTDNTKERKQFLSREPVAHIPLHIFDGDQELHGFKKKLSSHPLKKLELRDAAQNSAPNHGFSNI